MQAALSNIDGVTSADISMEDQRVVIRHTAAKVDKEILIQAVKDAGFGASEEIPGNSPTKQAD